jgi:hypothetical protein
MAATHEHSSTFARNLLRIARANAGTSHPDRQSIQPDDLQHYADLCSGVLREARSLVGEGTFGPALSGLLTRASDLLDDIDEVLIAMDPLQNSEAYLCAAELHRALEEIQARVPRQFRGRRFVTAPEAGRCPGVNPR